MALGKDDKAKRVEKIKKAITVKSSVSIVKPKKKTSLTDIKGKATAPSKPKMALKPKDTKVSKSMSTPKPLPRTKSAGMPEKPTVTENDKYAKKKYGKSSWNNGYTN